MAGSPASSTSSSASSLNFWFRRPGKKYSWDIGVGIKWAMKVGWSSAFAWAGQQNNRTTSSSGQAVYCLKKRPQIVPLSWCLRVAAPRPRRCNSPNERSVCQHTPKLSRTVLGLSRQLSGQDYFQRWQKVGVKTQTTNFLLLNAHYFLALSRQKAALKESKYKNLANKLGFLVAQPGKEILPMPTAGTRCRPAPMLTG